MRNLSEPCELCVPNGQKSRVREAERIAQGKIPFRKSKNYSINLIVILSWTVWILTGITAPVWGEIEQFSDTQPLTVSANVGYTYKQKNTEIWLLRGNCTLSNGSTYYAEASEMVLWIDCDENRIRQGKNGSYRLIAYLKGQASGKMITGDLSARSPMFQAKEWIGAFYNYVKPKTLVNYERNTPGDLPELYWTGLRFRQIQHKETPDAVSSLNYALTQFRNEGTPTVVPPVQTESKKEAKADSKDDKKADDKKATDKKTDDKKPEAKPEIAADKKAAESPVENPAKTATANDASDAKSHAVALPIAGVAGQVAPLSGAVGQSASLDGPDSGVPVRSDASDLSPSAGAYTLPPRIPPSHILQEINPQDNGAGPLCPSDIAAVMPRGYRRISIYRRADVPPDVRWNDSHGTGQSVGIINSGVNIIIDGMPGGTIDILTDKLVIWHGSPEKLNSGSQIQRSDIPLEFYMEGNIVFRQGDRTLRADRMYYDVTNNRGTIKNSELLTAVPDYQGMLRINAETMHQINSNDFFAQNAFVTSSRMGEPSYKMTMKELLVHDQIEPKLDPQSLAPILDDNGNPQYTHVPTIEGKEIGVYTGDLRIFSWPVLSTRLDRTTMYIEQLQFKTDSVFGFQAWSTWNAYELLGLKHPMSGTKWTIDIDPLTKRGIGHGTNFEFNRFMDRGLFSGPIQGDIDFWGIYDWGKDNLGYQRRAVQPEEKYRYKMLGNIRHTFGRGLELQSQFGVLSDRDFMEEYFENDWYLKESPHTGVMLRQEIDNMSWDLAADVKVNNFYTETQQIPRFDHFWIGESLLMDRLTWYTHSSAGYYQLKPGSLPTAPENLALYGRLPWEQECSSGRFTTRHELDCPLQAGPVKIVPYVMGEVGYWGDSPSNDQLTRIYGQAGVRASIPIWKTNPNVCSQLWNLHGLSHKVSFEAEWYVGASDVNMEDLPLYDALDDQSVLQYRHLVQATTFGTMLPWQFDPRSYALRSGLGNAVTSPGIEILDDMNVVRLGVNQRWQTHRGPVGYQNTIDWITLNAGVSLFPNSKRDNFGDFTGLWNYDFRWHVGDRFSVLSSGLYDTVPDGIKAWSLGGQLDKPGQGSLYLGLYTLSGPVQNTVLTVQANYWLSPKWYASFVSDFDISGQGNIGQRLSFTRVGESLLVRCGFYVDATRDDFGVSITLEPRFLSKGSLAKKLGVAPTGTYGLE